MQVIDQKVVFKIIKSNFSFGSLEVIGVLFMGLIEVPFLIIELQLK